MVRIRHRNTHACHLWWRMLWMVVPIRSQGWYCSLNGGSSVRIFNWRQYIGYWKRCGVFWTEGHHRSNSEWFLCVSLMFLGPSDILCYVKGQSRRSKASSTMRTLQSWQIMTEKVRTHAYTIYCYWQKVFKARLFIDRGGLW